MACYLVIMRLKISFYEALKNKDELNMTSNKK